MTDPFKRAQAMVTGSIVAIVTPMQDDGRLDYERFKSLIQALGSCLR